MKLANICTKLGIIAASVATFSTLTMKSAQAGSFINFETVPNSSPSDDLAISNQFSSMGVNFGIDNDGDGIADSGLFPELEKVGSSKDEKDNGTRGFVNGGKGDDVAEAGYEDRLGDYFLRTAGLGGKGGSLLITYDKATKAASGELWDNDGNKRNNRPDRTEQWEVQALGADGSILEALISPEGDTSTGPLDGKPWLWSFQRDTADVKAIRFVFIGDSPSKNVGLAFDNFSAFSVEGDEVSIPEPAAVMGLIAVAGVGASSLRRRHSAA